MIAKPMKTLELHYPMIQFLIKPICAEVCQQDQTLPSIDHFHKWRPIINSFANIKISLTNLILKLIIQKSFYSATRLVRLI